MMVVLDVVHPHMTGASNIDDQIEVTCVPTGRATRTSSISGEK
jgi:hypothetical protein